MTNSEKVRKAMEIIKALGASGKFRAYVKGNTVELCTESGYYATVNVMSGNVKGA